MVLVECVAHRPVDELPFRAVGKGVIQAMGDLEVLRLVRGADVDAVTHINVGGIRYLPLAPVSVLRRAVREYQDTCMPARFDTLGYLAEKPSVLLCREDWEKAVRAASGAASDLRLSPEARSTFARIRDVLNHAIPRYPRGRAFSS